MAILATWADKGGVGKTTLATTIAATLKAPLIDLDPQGDATRWSTKASHTCTTPKTEAEIKALLSTHANSKDLVVVDCPPGHDPRSLAGALVARLVLIPTRSGEADIVAFGRGLSVLQELRTKGNPTLQIGVVLNAYRDTSRAQTVDQAIRDRATSGGYHYLGRLGERVHVEEAYAKGKSIFHTGGPAAHEMRVIIDRISSIKLF